MALIWPPKDPDEVLDYELDWTARLAGDTISTSTWILPPGITKDSNGHVSDSHDSTTTLIWLSGGTLGETYELTNRIMTVGTREMDQSMKLKVKAK